MNINPRLKLALIRAYSPENGFTLVLVTLAGLAMTVVAIGMILSTYQNVKDSLAQNQNSTSCQLREDSECRM